MSDNTIDLLRTAFNDYLEQFYSHAQEPVDDYLPYEFDYIDQFQWRIPGDEIVKGELRELTNLLNHWHESLKRWQAWNKVIQPHNEINAWELRREFLEALAHQCLLQPSAIRDTFTFVATNSMHQIRLSSDTNYPDYIEGEPKTPTDKPNYPTRRKKEERLAKLISIWAEANDFLNSLRQLSDNLYRQETSDYRNLTSHCIGPRLGIGITRTVSRSVTQKEQLTVQPGGTYLLTPVPEKMSAVYGLGGGIEPIDMEKARVSNLEQYRRARQCYNDYLSLLNAGLKTMPSASKTKE